MKYSFTKTIGLLLLPIIAVGAIHLTHKNGTVQGSASSNNGDAFSVIAEEINLKISAVENGTRSINVSIPVKSITTENWMRDTHMRMSIFNKKFPNVEFSSRTDALIQDGALSLDGILTINGIEKSHSMELTLKNRGQEYSVFGVTAVSMEAYEIAAPGMGPMKVNDLVQLKIDFQIPTADLQK